jgi:hypothetical protein
MKTILLICLMSAYATAQVSSNRIKVLPSEEILAIKTMVSSPNDTSIPTKNSSNKNIFDAFGLNNNSRTPFQILEELFNAGAQTKLGEFPLVSSCSQGKNFTVLQSLDKDVLPQTKLSELNEGDDAFLVRNNVVIHSGGIKREIARGPAMPSIPPVPSVDVVFPNVLSSTSLYAASFGCDYMSSLDYHPFDYLYFAHYSFEDSSVGASEHLYSSDHDVVSLFHSAKGLIVQRKTETVIDAAGVKNLTISYNYFWRINPNAKYPHNP